MPGEIGDGKPVEGPPGQKMTPQECYDFGTQRESWCSVETKKEQDWCRAERKHFPDQFKSTVFQPKGPSEASRRCTWKVSKPTHSERRHYATTFDNKWKE